MLTKKAKYGLKALLLLARESDRGPIRVSELSLRERIPKKFLDSILLELKHSGIVQSQKGRAGGYFLGRPATEITVGEAIRVLNGPLAPLPCVSKTAYMRCTECVDEPTCAIRATMQDVRDATARTLDGTSLAAANLRTQWART